MNTSKSIKSKLPQIKSFRRFMKEESEKWYSLDLYQDMTKEEVVYLMNQLFPLMYKMLKNTDVTIQVLPVLESDEE